MANWPKQLITLRAHWGEPGMLVGLPVGLVQPSQKQSFEKFKVVGLAPLAPVSNIPGPFFLNRVFLIQNLLVMIEDDYGNKNRNFFKIK